MKKTTISLLTFIILNLAFATPINPLIQVSSSASNMEPGKTGYITVSLRNDGAQPANDAKIALVALSSPLSSDSLCANCIKYSTTRKLCLEYADECYTNLGDIYGSDSKEAVYAVKIPNDAPTGYYLAEFSIKYVSYNNTSGTEKDKYISHYVVFKIENNETKPDLGIASVTTEPKVVMPGENFNITLKIKNYGDYSASKAKLEVTSDHFSTRNNASIINIGDLKSQESKEVLLELGSDKDLLPGLHEISFKLSYEKDGEYTYSQESSFGVLVGGNTTFEVYIQNVEPEYVINGTKTSVILSVANTGVLDASSVSVRLHESKNLVLGNVAEDFLGDLNPGDFTSASFTFMPINYGPIDLVFEIGYTNQLGQRVSYNITRRIYLGYGTQAVSAEGINIFTIFSQNLGVLILFGVLLLLLYFFLKSKRKRE